MEVTSNTVQVQGGLAGCKNTSFVKSAIKVVRISHAKDICNVAQGSRKKSRGQNITRETLCIAEAEVSQNGKGKY